MYKNIMVALDGSSHGQVAISQAIALAQRSLGRLQGVHVLNTAFLRGSILRDFSGSLGIEPQMHMSGQLEQFMGALAKEIFATFEEKCALEGVVSRTSIRRGEVAEALAEVADIQDLLVLGKRGAAYDDNKQRGAGYGSIRRLQRFSNIPLLLTGLTVSRLERPLLMYDGSPGAHRALMDATRLTSVIAQKLVICHLRESGDTNDPDPLDEARQYLEPYGIDAEMITIEGKDAQAVADYVTAHGHDVVFLGYQGSSRLKELAFGHTSDSLMNLVECPVWVAK